MNAIKNTASDHNEKMRWNLDQYLPNRARAYFTDGQSEKARRDLKEVEYWHPLIHGNDRYYHGDVAPLP